MNWLKSLFTSNDSRDLVAITSEQDKELEDAFLAGMRKTIDASQHPLKDTLETLPSNQRAAYAAYVLESEVLNGGFNQFFFNSSGELADMALEGFRLLGQQDFIELVAKATETYAGIKSELDKKNDGSVEAFAGTYKDNPLNDLSLAFVRLARANSLTTIRAKFMREHPDDFRF